MSRFTRPLFFQRNPGVDAQVFLEVAPGLAAQGLQGLDFIGEEAVGHNEVNFQDLQAGPPSPPGGDTGGAPPA